MNDKRNKPIDDEMIAFLVGAVKHKIPSQVEKSLDEAITHASTQEQRRRIRKRNILWYPVSAAAAALLIISALVLFQHFPFKNSERQVAPISEIKTHLEIKDKNIKILWVQKKDFKLDLNQ